MISVTIPVRIESESNKREHWSKGYSRKKNQAAGVRLVLATGKGAWPELPVIVTLTRAAPRLLDGDNLQGALKHIRDAIADLLIPGLRPGQADGDPRITWVYAQRKQSKVYTLEIEIKPREIEGYQT